MTEKNPFCVSHRKFFFSSYNTNPKHIYCSEYNMNLYCLYCTGGGYVSYDHTSSKSKIPKKQNLTERIHPKSRPCGAAAAEICSASYSSSCCSHRACYLLLKENNVCIGIALFFGIFVCFVGIIDQ